MQPDESHRPSAQCPRRLHQRSPPSELGFGAANCRPPQFAALPAVTSSLGCRRRTLQAVQPGERLVTILVTLSVPDAADAGDTAALIAVAADVYLVKSLE